MPAQAGIQYAVRSRLNNERLGLLVPPQPVIGRRYAPTR
jgi:hypothetical protein